MVAQYVIIVTNLVIFRGRLKPSDGLRYFLFIVNKRASLACAARLADTSCPPEALFGRLKVTLVNYKGDIISKYVHLSFKI